MRDQNVSEAPAAAISVIIPCRDDTHLASTIESLAAQEVAQPFETVVIANLDHDLSARLGPTNELLPLRILKVTDRATAGDRRNTGVAASRGRFLLFVDADDIVEERYVAAMANALESHEMVCSYVDVNSLNASRVPVGHPQEHGLITTELGFLPFAGAGTLGIRRSLFEEIGGFDPCLPCYEEADLCWRAQLTGHEPPAHVADARLRVRIEQHHRKRLRKALAFGEIEAVLYRRYRHAGMPRESLSQSLAAWASIMTRLVRRMAGDESTAGVGWNAAIRVGRLRGSARYRVAYF